MPMYYEGMSEALEAVKSMSEEDLLMQIDGLYGRDNLRDNYSLDELRREALEQTRLDFTDKSSSEYDIVQFFVAAVRAETKG